MFPHFLRFIFLGLTVLCLSSCAVIAPRDRKIETQNHSGAQYQANIDADKKVELAKKRRSYVQGIRKWDFYSLRNAPEEALAYYLSVQEHLPDDLVIQKKIAHVYFVMKNWSQAYIEYVKIPYNELLDAEKDELFASLFFDTSTFDRIGELWRIPMSTGSMDYYRRVDTCYTTIHDCIVSIQSYTGSEPRIQALQKSIQDAEKISPDYQYRNLLIASKYYEQGMYRATTEILSELLAERPDYLEAKKIIGFSFFELGEYEEAKKYILQYLDRNPTDMESIVRMGEISYFLGNIVSSNLYYNNAVTAWYSPKTDLERRLAYNYSLLGDVPSMMKVIGYLLREDDVLEDDFAVGVSLALDESQYERAEAWAKSGLEKFNNSHMLTPLLIETLRLLGKRDEAISILQNTWEDTMIDNPNYLLEKALLTFDSGDMTEAEQLFRELSLIEWWPDISEEAHTYLSVIEKAKMPVDGLPDAHENR